MKMLTVTVLTVAAAVAIPTTLQASVAGAAEVGEKNASGTAETYVRYQVPLDHPTDLRSAMSLSDAADPIVAYGYSNGPLVGEFAPATSSPEQFLKRFKDRYGVSPAVNYVVRISKESDVPDSPHPEGFQLIRTDVQSAAVPRPC